ncbi:hypothetical protein [Mucilaginibacter flavidus]|uniref:hypothetical protein n=1 Tax=Mucilaginibacter flavidus TaxID=2949309 RepID=UPI0020920A79|nr:hypothetical protein [Mucilaginibacter flavidus]MCO5948814.1 hypothetical protein [Mucilaginibacter flavidus]
MKQRTNYFIAVPFKGRDLKSVLMALAKNVRATILFVSPQSLSKKDTVNPEVITKQGGRKMFFITATFAPPQRSRWLKAFNKWRRLPLISR